MLGRGNQSYGAKSFGYGVVYIEGLLLVQLTILWVIMLGNGIFY